MSWSVTAPTGVDFNMGVTTHFADSTSRYIHDIIPKHGFYVDKSGILYLDGMQVCGDDERKFDARSKECGEDCRKDPTAPVLPTADNKLVEQFMPAALSLAKAWDDTYQEGRMSIREAKTIKDNPRPPEDTPWCAFAPIPGHALVWNGSEMRWTALPYSDHVALDEEHIEEIVERVTEHQETQISLLSAQVDSLQSQINAANAVKIEEAFADEKFDSFKNRAKETLKEAFDVIEDMEGLDQLHQAKAIKEAALAENKRQLVLTTEMVRERLKRLQNINKKNKSHGNISIVKIAFAILILTMLIALAVIYGPAVLTLIF